MYAYPHGSCSTRTADRAVTGRQYIAVGPVKTLYVSLFLLRWKFVLIFWHRHVASFIYESFFLNIKWAPIFYLKTILAVNKA